MTRELTGACYVPWGVGVVREVVFEVSDDKVQGAFFMSRKVYNLGEVQLVFNVMCV